MKRCRRCELVKKLSDFQKSNQGTFGRNPYCRECNKILGRLYYYNKKAYRKELAAIKARGDDKRLWGFVNKNHPSGCWIWTGTIRNGYGRFRLGKVHVTAHRLVYEKLVGKIPDRLTLDHLCRNRSCVNPAHLEVTSNRTNCLRGFGPAAINARKTRCKRGHSLSGKNLYVLPSGSRACRACVKESRNTPEYKAKKQEWDRNYRLRKKSLPIDNGL